MAARHQTWIDPVAEVRECKQCRTIKPFTAFYKNGTSHGGVRTRCKECWAEHERTVLRPKYADRRLAARRLKRHGVDPVAYNTLFTTQNGQCAICKRSAPLNIDHDHATGKVRGLLCHGCNVSLGHFRDEPALLESAIAYLLKNKGN